MTTGALAASAPNVDGVDYCGKGPETLGPLDFDMNISKDFIATLGQRSVANAS
jgi:hypothetical protein